MTQRGIAVARALLLISGLMLVSVQAVTAGTIVQVETSLGAFYIELDDAAAPRTTANFLGYVNAGRYNHTIIHEVDSGAAVRGGAYTFASCGAGAEPIATDPPVSFEDTGLSNLSGSIAMRRQADDLDSATSEWFINLGNDPDLDTRNGGYVVFGRVIGDGLEVVNAIANAESRSVGFLHPTPVINYAEDAVDCATFTRDKLVQVLMYEAVANTAAASSQFDSASNSLNISIDLATQGFASLQFDLVATDPQVVIRADLASLVTLAMPVPRMAGYDTVTGELLLPELAVDGEIVFTDVHFVLTDAEALEFTLQGYD